METEAVDALRLTREAGWNATEDWIRKECGCILETEIQHISNILKL